MAQAIPQPESMTGRQPRLTYFGCKIIAGILKVKGILCISAGKMKACDVLISHPTRAEESCHFNTHLPGMSHIYIYIYAHGKYFQPTFGFKPIAAPIIRMDRVVIIIMNQCQDVQVRGVVSCRSFFWWCVSLN